jgi:hypothetical protein
LSKDLNHFRLRESDYFQLYFAISGMGAVFANATFNSGYLLRRGLREPYREGQDMGLHGGTGRRKKLELGKLALGKLV